MSLDVARTQYPQNKSNSLTAYNLECKPLSGVAAEGDKVASSILIVVAAVMTDDDETQTLR